MLIYMNQIHLIFFLRFFNCYFIIKNQRFLVFIFDRTVFFLLQKSYHVKGIWQSAAMGACQQEMVLSVFALRDLYYRRMDKHVLVWPVLHHFAPCSNTKIYLLLKNYINTLSKKKCSVNIILIYNTNLIVYG